MRDVKFVETATAREQCSDSRKTDGTDPMARTDRGKSIGFAGMAADSRFLRITFKPEKLKLMVLLAAERAFERLVFEAPALGAMLSLHSWTGG